MNQLTGLKTQVIGPVRIIHPLIIFGLTLVVYVVTMPQAITLEDAGLFQMVCHMDGIAHPPGYPLFTLLCQPLTWSPNVVNGNMLSAVFASMTAAVFYDVCMRLRDDRAFAWVAALAYGYSATFWSQAIIIEVYTLATLMFVICWWLLIVYLQKRQLHYWLIFCFAYGLSLSNHWPLMVLSTPALLVMLWPVRTWLFEQLKQIRFWLVSLGCFILGLTPYISLVTNHDPAIALYGSIDSLKEFLEYVSRSTYSDTHATAQLHDKFLYGLWLLKISAIQFGWMGLPLLVAGIIISLRTVSRNLNLSLLTLYLGSTFVLLMLLDFEYRHISRAVFKPYPVIAYLALAFWFALGVVALSRIAARFAGWASPFIIIVSVLLVILPNFAENYRRDTRLVSKYGEAVLNSLPPDSILFVRGDNQTGVIGYLHHVKKIRTDIELRDWDNLVFENRMMSPWVSDKKWEAVVQKYINETSRKSFSLNPWFTSHIDFGAYYQASPRDGYGFLPELDNYLDYLLTLYLGGYIKEAHEQDFAFKVILQYARQYAGYAASFGVENMDNIRKARLTKLQLTFPGRLATLEARIEEASDRAALLEIARLAESNIPEFAPTASVAVFYELYGRVLMIEPAEPVKALHYFGLSVDAWPLAANASICRMIEIHEKRENQDAIAELLARFPEAEC